MKRYLIVVLTLIIFSANAQNDIQFSHFMFNELIYNPAVAGNSNKIHANLVARQQWMGVENAPSTQFLNAHTWLEKIGGGVGLVILNDKLGFENSLTARLNYAYHLKLSEKATISAGLSAGFINKRLDGTKLIFEEAGDQYAIYARQSAFKP
ncbi:MAG: PorP/SprF family type IX secretion system membrane protein, partial [Bacteroidia bacterium]